MDRLMSTNSSYSHFVVWNDILYFEFEDLVALGLNRQNVKDLKF